MADIEDQPDDDLFASARIEAQGILDSLTERQTAVLDRAARMQTYDQIAYEMALHRRTIEDHITAARKKLSAKNRTDAVRKYVLLLDICGKPTRGYIRVELTPEDIEKILRDLSFERATQLLSSPEFERFMQAYRSTGPEAWDAQLGPWWRPVAALGIALLVIALLISGITLAPLLDQLFAD